MEHAWDELPAQPVPTRTASLPTSSPSLRTLRKRPYTAAHVTAFRTAPAKSAAVVPMRDAYEARWTDLLNELELATPTGLSRLTLFGAMNAAVEWFDAERGNLDELAEIIARQFSEGVMR